MFPTRILVAVDGFEETSWAVRAAVESASGTGSELHVVHVVPAVPELPYLHLAAKERVEDFTEWRRIKGLEVLDKQVRHIREDLGGTVAASYYREGKPDKQIDVLGEEIDAGLLIVGGLRQAPFERIFAANLAEKVLRRADRPVLMVDDRGSRDLPIARQNIKLLSRRCSKRPTVRLRSDTTSTDAAARPGERLCRRAVGIF